MISYDQLKIASDFISERIKGIPDAAVVLGSGLGHLADSIDSPVVINYEDIPAFPRPSVEGHSGRLVYGKMCDKNVLLLQGRVHYYEGYSRDQVVMPVRVTGLLGTKSLILTNAAGGISDNLSPGDIMVIEDHISSFIPSPLIYPDYYKLGDRFPDMSEVYDREYMDILESCFESCNLPYKPGIYVQVTGPQYETPAEIRMYRSMGADAVGMSTVCEAIAARHMGMRIAGMSVVCNKAAGLGGVLSHEDIIKNGDIAASRLKHIIEAFLNCM